ncbi:MAG: acetate/propionate family kinase [Pseudomonadota bacterium]
MSDQAILTINAGSSSIKFSVYDPETMVETVNGQVDSLSPSRQTTMKIEFLETGKTIEENIDANDHALALQQVLRHGDAMFGGRLVAGVGHRVVHGGAIFDGPAVLTEDVFETLATFEPLAPLHQPHNLAAARAASATFPDAVQVACFDTAFHRTHPWVNDTFALPREWYDKGVRRYGFHGLSYDYITGVLAKTEPQLADGRVIVCHLGNGASMCAIRDEISVGSTMGFSALDGLPMGTRCGQLDPGVLLYLMAQEGMSAKEIETLLYKESGLKGLSGMSNDMRELEASDDPAAKQAIDYFVFRIRREIGGMASVLEGLDGIVFCGGIGENSRTIRKRVCENMEWLGIEIDDAKNQANERDIGAGRVRVMVIPTDEEIVIARAVKANLHLAESAQRPAA